MLLQGGETDYHIIIIIIIICGSSIDPTFGRPTSLLSRGCLGGGNDAAARK